MSMPKFRLFETTEDTLIQWARELNNLVNNLDNNGGYNIAVGGAATAQAAADAAQGTADTAIAYTNNLASDAVITPDEKVTLKQAWDLIVTEATATTGKIPAQAIAFGVAHDVFDAAYAALNLYLNTTITVFASMTTATTGLVRATWDTKWKDYYNARTDILNAIATQAKALADTAQGAINTLAPAGVIEVAKLGTTVIDGGYLKTSLVAAQSLTADKIASSSGNLANNFDSFEQYGVTTIPGSESNLTSCVVDDVVSAVHGRYSLHTVNSAANSYKFLSTANGQIKLQLGKYLVSGYVRTTSAQTNVQLIPTVRQGETLTANTTYGTFVAAEDTTLEVADGWVRIVGSVTVTSLADNPWLTVYVRTVTAAARTVYWDAIQVEFIGSRTDSIPAPFNPAGTTIIDGGMVSTGTIKVGTAGGERLEMAPAGGSVVTGYDVTNTKRAEYKNDSAEFFDTNGVSSGKIQAEANIAYPGMSIIADDLYMGCAYGDGTNHVSMSTVKDIYTGNTAVIQVTDALDTYAEVRLTSLGGLAINGQIDGVANGGTFLHTGNTGLWAAWTPTTNGITKGSGTIVSRYCTINKTVHFLFSFVLAADSAITGSVSFTLPVTGAYASVGTGRLVDATGSAYSPYIALSTTTCSVLVYKGDSTYVYWAAISSTVPFTWTTSDAIYVSGTYEMA